MAANFDNLTGKLVIVVYTKPSGQSIRTLAVFKELKEGMAFFESPTQHLGWAVNVTAVNTVYELPKEQIRADRL
jgi:hypothetical protein